ncbi:threonyl/alanyl tRNA synthetase SAD [Halorubrum californiense DSM 19288]|uniref:Threonyl/alanyl tRNA synthetase SAD n=1 Tax=Halorubrum californiense DSM 19288 TaxID=1227465 RepID=M0EAC1_9EURY|nr:MULTISPECIES: alanyl-tRNA editing protein [Halorubrum]ELZ44751.1 threonyl/alanyl tRNA synthetase SAD [Halorubrum californiense DSM 19288]TKX71788.1 alanyl-tRNA editing protein [Halorubrum sp. GN11GM_10-3_MGM]
MTERLYLADDTVTAFEATVERVLSDPDRLVLDRTHFYPTGGGQPHDTGTIRVADGDGDARWRVVDVEMRDTVYHEVEPIGGVGGAGDGASDADDAPALPEPGIKVACEVDAERRAAHSRYHTAQHLLSALLLDEFDARTTGNQLYADRARLDAEYDRFTDDDLDRIESRLNELVADGRAVSSDTMDRETAEATLDTDRTRIDLLPDSIEELRIVEIAGADAGDEPYDRTACAGTHVANTADIGEVVVTGRETKGPDEERVRFALAEHVDAD